MKKKIKNVFLVMGLIFIITLLLANFLAFFVIYDKLKIPERPLYEQVSKRFAETHTYNNNKTEGKIYNCVNYSKDLSDVLNKLGYNATTKIVNNGTHEIITLHLDIEPQTADIVLGEK